MLNIELLTPHTHDSRGKTTLTLADGWGERSQLAEHAHKSEIVLINLPRLSHKSIPSTLCDSQAVAVPFLLKKMPQPEIKYTKIFINNEWVDSGESFTIACAVVNKVYLIG